MPTLIIADKALEVSPRFESGYALTDVTELNAFRSLWLFRLQSRILYWLKRNPEADAQQAQAWAWTMARDYIFTDEPDPDVLDTEAQSIATEVLKAKLAAESLPLPNNFEQHVLALADAPEIRAKAKLRVEARSKIYGNAIKELGASP